MAIIILGCSSVRGARSPLSDSDLEVEDDSECSESGQDIAADARAKVSGSGRRQAETSFIKLGF